MVTAVCLFLTMKPLIGRVHRLVGGDRALHEPELDVYIQTTALTEPVLLMSMTASSYFLLR